MAVHAVGLPIGLPWLPYDEQFNETKTFGFLGDELRAGINQVGETPEKYLNPKPLNVTLLNDLAPGVSSAEFCLMPVLAVSGRRPPGAPNLALPSAERRLIGLCRGRLPGA